MEKKKYNWLVVYLLNLVTCCIYNIVWLYQMGEKNNEIAEKYGIFKTQNYIIAYLLGMITCGIYPIYWMYKFCEQQILIAQASGVENAPTNSPILMLLITFVPFYSIYALCDNYNRTAEAN